jgi:hypothetical protein
VGFAALFLLALVVDGASLALLASPQYLVPRPPYWRWAVAILATAALCLSVEPGIERIWLDVEEVKESRDPVVKWGVILLAALLTAGLLGGTALLWWFLLGSSMGAAV